MANYIRQYVLIYYDTVIYNSINNEPMCPVSFIATEPSWKLDVLAGLLSLTLCNPRLLCPRNSPGKNTGVGRHSLLQEMQIQSLGWEDPLAEVMATHSRILVWRIPWTEEPGGLQSIGSQRVRHD